MAVNNTIEMFARKYDIPEDETKRVLQQLLKNEIKDNMNNPDAIWVDIPCKCVIPISASLIANLFEN